MKSSKCIVSVVFGCTILLLFFINTSLASAIRGASSDLPFTRLEWIHKGTGRLIFSQEDILAFDWEKQMFLLTDNAAMNMALYPVGLVDPFEVRANNDFLYEGAFVSMFSSRGYRGPIIMGDNIGEFLTRSLYQIHNGYPTDLPSRDIRYNEALKRVLDKAGLIQTIDPNNPPAPISCKSFEWLGEKDGLRVWIDAFPDTFVQDGLARFHFRLTSRKYPYPDGDYVIDVRATLTANTDLSTTSKDGQVVLTVHRMYPVSQEYLWATNPVGMVLSGGVAQDSGKTKPIQEGPASLTLDIAIRRVLDKEKCTYSEPIESLRTKAVPITILPRKQSHLSPEAEGTIRQFQQSLQKQNWQEAIALCSDAVGQKAKDLPPQEFIDAYIPLENIQTPGQIPVCGWSSNRDGRPVRYTCFVDMPQSAVQWVWYVEQDPSGVWRIDFPLTLLTEKIASEKARLLAEESAARQRASEMQKCLKTILVPIQDEYVIGKPMRFRLELTNISGSVYTFEKTSFMVNDPLAIQGPSGEIIRYVEPGCQTMVRPMDIQPGQTLVLEEDYDAAARYIITTPGQYSFQFAKNYLIPLSNIVKIQIQPGTPRPKDIITQHILSILPQDWEFSRTETQTQDKQGLIAELSSYSSKTRAAPRVVVLLFVNPDKQVIEDSRNRVQLLGQTQWGPVFISQFNAELLWPEYREELIRALSIQPVSFESMLHHQKSQKDKVDRIN